MSEEGLFDPIEIESSPKQEAEKKEGLAELKRLCDLYKSQEKEIEQLEEDLKKAKINLEITSRTHIPTLVQAYGLSKIELNTGEKVTIVDQLKVSLSDVQTNAAIVEMMNLQFEEDYRFLMKKEEDKLDRPLMHYEGDLIFNDAKKLSTEKVMSLFKQKLELEGTEEDLKETKEFFTTNHIPYSFKQFIHNATLKKYCKDRRGSGLPVPKQINVFPYQETKIKKDK